MLQVNLLAKVLNPLHINLFIEHIFGHIYMTVQVTHTYKKHISKSFYFVINFFNTIETQSYCPLFFFFFFLLYWLTISQYAIYKNIKIKYRHNCLNYYHCMSERKIQLRRLVLSLTFFLFFFLQMFRQL